MGYETAKDAITYSIILGVCEGLLLFFADQRRRQEMQTLRAELAEARLSRLAEQIQPHFLFNTLNLISSVMYEDVALADRLLCDLATLLRQALAAQQAGQHTLAQELALVEPYLAIMRSRFGERLQIGVDASPQARECLLPALLLIAPVENAIKHDVALSRDRVTVTVSARVEGGRLLLAVANSGAPPARDEREGAVGLANTRERLHSRYGAAAQVALTAGAEGGSLLSLSLPAESAPA
jgi:LytS/YehU family sensor histidine kinase